MSDSTTSSAPNLVPYKAGRAPHPHVFHRAFGCGHPDEFIEVCALDDKEEVHNLITLEVVLCHTWDCDSLPAYYEARCLICAKKAKEEDDKDPNVRPKRTLRAYQAGTSTTLVQSADASPNSGFDWVLERYKIGGQGADMQPHPRVTEEEHRAHRQECQKKAAVYPGKWISVPLRRVWNAPLQTAGEAKHVSYLFEDEDKEALQSRYNAAHKHAHSHKMDGTSGSVSPIETDVLLAGYYHEPELDKDEDAGDLIITRTEVDHVSNFSHPPHACNSANHQRSRETSISKASPLEDQGKRSLPQQTIDQYTSPYNDSSDPPLVDLKIYEHPRSSPTIPKTGLLDSMRRRSRTSTKASTKSNSLSRNFRKLRVDVQHAKSIKKVEPDSDSPDWACQTSLAIEAGRISIDSVSKRSHEWASPNHMAHAMGSPTSFPTGERRVVQDARRQANRSGQRRNTYSSPPSPSSLAPSAYGRYLEGAPRVEQRANTACRPGRLEGMEKALREEPLRRDSAQATVLVDLNKSLPALPPHVTDSEDERDLA